jgi:class 3 adenylate cyclase
MMTAFDSAADAVRCAVEIRDEIRRFNDAEPGEPLLVRFGINAGEPIEDRDDLFGLSVTLAARIGDWGEPGQVLVSDVVRQLLLGKGFTFEHAGDAELKGFESPLPVFRVDAGPEESPPS